MKFLLFKQLIESFVSYPKIGENNMSVKILIIAAPFLSIKVVMNWFEFLQIWTEVNLEIESNKYFFKGGREWEKSYKNIGIDQT